MDLEELFNKNPIFGSLTASERDKLSEISFVRQYQKNQYLAHAGDTWPYLFVLLKGSIAAVKESLEGRSLVAATLKPGDVFWGVAFFHPQLPMPVSLRIDHHSSLILWTREQLLPIIQANGSFSWELSRMMVSRMLQASEIVEQLAFQPVAVRLARLLIDYPGHTDSGPIARSLTLDEMAARIGSTREMVCRFLQRFADEELIHITRTEFEITNPNRLTTIAQKDRAA